MFLFFVALIGVHLNLLDWLRYLFCLYFFCSFAGFGVEEMEVELRKRNLESE